MPTHVSNGYCFSFWHSSYAWLLTKLYSISCQDFCSCLIRLRSESERDATVWEKGREEERKKDMKSEKVRQYDILREKGKESKREEDKERDRRRKNCTHTKRGRKKCRLCRRVEETRGDGRKGRTGRIGYGRGRWRNTRHNRGGRMRTKEKETNKQNNDRDQKFCRCKQHK